jgi:hypothetical protein
MTLRENFLQVLTLYCASLHFTIVPQSSVTVLRDETGLASTLSHSVTLFLE